VLCPSCQAENREGARFCKQCGTALALRCSTCGAAHAEGQRFCDECGASLGAGAGAAVAPPADAAVAAELRMASMLFVDLVGFTTLSESRDAEDVRELLGRYFDTARTIVARYGGTIEKFIGDAVMAVWGAPVAREDDAERAVRAGLDIVDAVSVFADEVGAGDLSARAGVVTGQVAALASPGESLVVGDRVNTASRVQSVARPGSVYVDDLTRQITSAAISYQDAGEHAVKGKAEPLRLWHAQRVVAGVSGAHRGEEELEATFVGREPELRLIKELFHSTVDRSSARLVAVSGAAGVGKTRLRWEFFKYIDGLANLVLWHSGRCPSYGDGVAYWALAEMVRARLGIPEEAEAAEAEAKLAAGLERWVQDAAEREFLTPRIGALLGVSEMGLSRQELFAGWRLFFERLADVEPVIMVFEDLQWADDGLLDFVEYLLDWAAERPIFILALARPELGERRPGWPPSRPAVTPMYLEPLPHEAVAALLEDLVEGLPSGALERIVSQSEGIPLYALETVRALVDRAALQESDGRLKVTGDVGELEVPATLSSLLTARLDGLQPEERALVKDLAVMGGSFPRAAVGAVSDLPPDRIDALLASLVRKQVLVVRSDQLSPDSGQYAFAQTLLRTVAYDMLSRHERKPRHLAVAAHLRAAFPGDGEDVAEVIAAHYLDAYEAAHDDTDAAELRAEALAALRRAAKRAETVGAPEAAERAYRTALELTDDEDERLTLTEAAGQAALIAGRFQESADLFEAAAKAHTAAGRDREAARLAAPMGRALNYMGRNEEAAALMEDALARLGSDQLDRSVAAINSELASCLTFAGEIERALAPMERALTAASALGEPELLCVAFTNKGVFCAFQGRHEEALMHYDAAIRIAQRHGLSLLRVRAEGNAGDACLRAGSPETLERTRAALEITRQFGDRSREAIGVGNVMLALLLEGGWDEAEQIGRERLEAASTPLPDPEFVLNRLALLHCLRGELGEARRALDGMASWKSTLNLEPRNLYQALEGLVLLAEGRADEALDVLCAMATEALRVEGAASEALRASWHGLIDAAVQTGKLDEVTSLSAELERQPPGWMTPFLRGLLDHGLGQLAMARGEDARVEEHFGAAIARLGELGYPYWLARSRAELGAWLIAGGRAAEATPLLDQAVETFESLRAAPALSRALELRAVPAAATARSA
jgi:class 3 adenylate cyclase/predicted ATPase